MPTGETDIAAIRREIIDLLGQQMEALNSPSELTDARLSECYERQARVQELREMLQAATSSHPEVAATSLATAAEAASGGPQPTLASLDVSASV